MVLQMWFKTENKKQFRKEQTITSPISRPLQNQKHLPKPTHIPPPTPSNKHTHTIIAVPTLVSRQVFPKHHSAHTLGPAKTKSPANSTSAAPDVYSAAPIDDSMEVVEEGFNPLSNASKSS